MFSITVISIVLNPNSFWAVSLRSIAQKHVIVLASPVLEEVPTIVEERCPHLLERWQQILESR